MSKYQYHEDGTQPKLDQIFVFGSNKLGRHGGGAAKAALDYYGAVYGDGLGLRGRSYALPTKYTPAESMPLDEINEAVHDFIEFASMNLSKKFFVTRVGCVLAGYQDSQIAVMFKHAPTNCNFPEQWKQYLE